MLPIYMEFRKLPLAELKNESESVYAKVFLNGFPYYIGSCYRALDQVRSSDARFKP